MQEFERRIRRPGPVAAAWRFAMGVPGQILVNTAAFTLPEELRIEPTWRILDIGCGRAGLARVLTDRAGLLEPAIGIDASRQMLELASRDQQGDGAKKVLLTQGSATDLPLADDLFNFVFSGHAF